MEFEEAKQRLKDFYILSKFDLVDEHTKELFFKFRDSQFPIREEEIKEYQSSQNKNYIRQDNQFSICNSNYREQSILFFDFRDRNFFYRDREIIFGEKNSDNLFVEINKCSTDFFNYFRLDSEYYDLSRRMFGGAQQNKIKSELSKGNDRIIELFYRMPITIKVHNLNALNTNLAIDKSNKIIETCLFKLSYLKNLTLMLEDEYTSSKSKYIEFNYSLNENMTYNSLPLSSICFNSDLIRFYQLGMSSDIPILKYLTFYQVLEYYFLRVNEEDLYHALSYQINDPGFTTTQKYLERLVKCFDDNNKNIYKETEMLKNVIKKFIEFNDLNGFIMGYEDFLGENIYTKKNIIFGQESEVQLKKDHIYGNIAKLIKIIRNALVHSSDRYERNERYIPFSESTQIVKKHIPLLKFLAEKVIIASGEPI